MWSGLRMLVFGFMEGSTLHGNGRVWKDKVRAMGAFE